MEAPQHFKKTLPPTSCGPAYKLCMPSELVTRFMSKFIDVEFELREASTQRRWQVQIGPRRNKAKFEYLLLGWRSVCEQNGMQAGDVVHFTVFDEHMEFSVAREGATLPAADANAFPSTFHSRGACAKCPNSAASSSEDKLQLDQLRRLDGSAEFPEFRQMAGSPLAWQIGPSCSNPRQAFPGTPRDGRDLPLLPSLPSAGPRNSSRDTLEQVLNLSMGLGLEGLPSLEGEREDTLLPASPMSSSISQRGRQHTTASGHDNSTGDAEDPFFDADNPHPAPTPEKGSPTPWPFTSRSSNPELMSWVPQHPSRESDPCPGEKRKFGMLESPWKAASATEPFPFTEGQKSPMPSPRLSTARTAPVKGSPGTRLQASSASEQSMHRLQGAKSADLGGEITALKRALQREKDRANWAEQHSAAMLQAMRDAEHVVRRQTNLGKEGLARICNAADRLTDMLMIKDLQWAKAEGLGRLQVQLKHQANWVDEALTRIQALTESPGKKAPSSSRDTESVARQDRSSRPW